MSDTNIDNNIYAIIKRIDAPLVKDSDYYEFDEKWYYMASANDRAAGASLEEMIDFRNQLKGWLKTAEIAIISRKQGGIVEIIEIIKEEAIQAVVSSRSDTGKFFLFNK